MNKSAGNWKFHFLCSEWKKIFLFANARKIYQFKTKDSEIRDYALYLGNISKDFKIMFRLIKKMFLKLLVSIVNASNHTSACR